MRAVVFRLTSASESTSVAGAAAGSGSRAGAPSLRPASRLCVRDPVGVVDRPRPDIMLLETPLTLLLRAEGGR